MHAESLRAKGESRMSSIGKENGLGQHRRKSQAADSQCSVQRNETGADGTEKVHHTNGHKVMMGHARWLETE